MISQDTWNESNDDYRVWDLHFKDKILREILTVNDRYHSHFLEMLGDNCEFNRDSDEVIESSDLMEFLYSKEILDRLNITNENDLSIVRKDPRLAGILLDTLESNWRNYHRWWNRKFFQLCKDLRLKDLDPRIWEYYGSKDSLGNPFGFKPTYPTEENKIQFCIETMVIFQTKGWNLMKNKI